MDDMEMTLAECFRRYGSDERPPYGWCERHRRTLEPGLIRIADGGPSALMSHDRDEKQG